MAIQAFRIYSLEQSLPAITGIRGGRPGGNATFAVLPDTLPEHFIHCTNFR